MTAFDVIGPFVVGIGTLLIGQFVLRYIYSYRLTDDAIQVVFLGIIPVRRIRFDDIERVEKYKLMRFNWNRAGRIPVFSTENWGNRVFGEGVVIKKYGVTTHVVITPDNADELIAAVEAKISSRPQ